MIMTIGIVELSKIFRKVGMIPEGYDMVRFTRTSGIVPGIRVTFEEKGK